MTNQEADRLNRLSFRLSEVLSREVNLSETARSELRIIEAGLEDLLGLSCQQPTNNPSTMDGEEDLT